MKKVYLKPVVVWAAKIISALLSFVLIFMFIQPYFIPKYLRNSSPLSSIVQGFYKLEKNSVDVVFMGASQTYCSIDTCKLTKENKISAYNFASSGQPMIITPYYLEEVFKNQSPKLVMIDVCRIFEKKSEVAEKELSWNYNPTPFSFEKYESLYNVFNGDVIKSVNYAYTPLFLYHGRWSAINSDDVGYVLNSDNYVDAEARGFSPREKTEKQELAFYNGDTTPREIPQESKEAMLKMAEISKANNTKLVFFKIPSSDWTKGWSDSVKSFMKDNNLDYIDLHDNLKEIDINPEKDFFDYEHLNTAGAEKTTRYLTGVVEKYLSE